MIFEDKEERIIPKPLAAFVVAIPIVMILIFSFSVLYYGAPGFSVDKTQNGLKIGTVRTPLNPVQSGDVIINIYGLTYHKILGLIISPSPFSNSNNTIIVQRENRQITFEPQLTPISPFRFLSIAWPNLLLMATLICLGIIAFSRAPEDQPGFVFIGTLCMFATSFSATLPSHFGILSPLIISLSFFTLAFANWLAFGSLLHFVYSFPSRRDIIKNKKWLMVLFYIAAPLISFVVALIFSNGGAEFWGWLQRFRNIALPLMALAAFSKHLIDYRTLSTTLEKNQIKLIISAYWLSFGPYFLLYAIPNIIFNRPFISFRLVVISSVILPMAYFFSLIQYRLLDVDRLISRTVSYFFLIGLLSISYSYLLVFLKRIFLGNRIFSEEFFLVYVIAIAIFFEPVNRFITFLMDKLFSPKALYRYDMVPALTRQIGSKIHLKDLIKFLTQTIPNEFKIKHLSLILYEDGNYKLYPEESSLTTLDLDLNPLKKQMGETTEYLFCNGFSSDPALKKVLITLSDNSIELIFPLMGGTGLLGGLLLGKKTDGRSYSRQDIQIFTTICNQSGLAIENSFHYESLVKSKQQIENMFNKVVQSEKMAALGEMSTVLAHELKNPLGIIRSAAQYLTKNLGDTKNQKELLEYIIGEVDGLETVIGNMIGLARYKSPELESLNLYLKLSSMIDHWIQSENHNKQVAMSVNCLESNPEILADFKQLQQVFLNCITNAEDAMPDGGDIQITIYPQADQCVQIQILDTGPGIAEENISNAFKKFFTTKEKGMGIGLPVCKQIISAHNGSISIQNSDKGGLMVLISLPRDPLSANTVSDSPDLDLKESYFV